jgi:DNA primase
MEKRWVDFRVIKAAVTMQMILNRYGLVLKQSGQELRGKCPIHHGSNDKHFTVNVSKNVFQCFFERCGAHGNLLDFVAAMEQCSVREAAIKLSEWFEIGKSAERPKKVDNIADELTVRRGIYRDKNDALYEVIGAAIDLEDMQLRIIYRELFGAYSLCIGQLELISSTKASAQPLFELVKAL